MTEMRLYLAQRISAAVMVPLVVGHLVLMVYAIQGGLSAEEILSRTRGSLAWGAFWGLFVAAVAVHGAIGLRAVAREWLGIGGALSAVLSWAVFALILAMGGRAVWAVTAGAAP